MSTIQSIDLGKYNCICYCFQPVSMTPTIVRPEIAQQAFCHVIIGACSPAGRVPHRLLHRRAHRTRLQKRHYTRFGADLDSPTF